MRERGNKDDWFASPLIVTLAAVAAVGRSASRARHAPGKYPVSG